MILEGYIHRVGWNGSHSISNDIAIQIRVGGPGLNSTQCRNQEGRLDSNSKFERARPGKNTRPPCISVGYEKLGIAVYAISGDPINGMRVLRTWTKDVDF